jgi:hypothetical protein
MSRILPAVLPLVLASCDRQPDAPRSGDGGPTPSLAASAPACALPLRQFAPHRRSITGSALDYPTNLVLVDRSGRLRWNGVPVGQQRLRDYIAHQARIDPPPVLVVQPDRGAPCLAVRQVLAAALSLGRCTPRRCAFEWPDTMAPPPPPDLPPPQPITVNR